MRSIHSLTSKDTGTIQYSYLDEELGKISPTFHEQTFCKRLIGAVNIATDYRQDVDSVITKDRHSKVTPEELARKWNIGIQTAKDTLQVTEQTGVRTAIHPMTRRVRVDHLHLHRPRLRGTWFCDTLISKVKSLLGNTCANVFTQGKFM